MKMRTKLKGEKIDKGKYRQSKNDVRKEKMFSNNQQVKLVILSRAVFRLSSFFLSTQLKTKPWTK